MYNTMEIGTLSAPMRIWANWNEMEPLAWPPRILSAKYMNELIYEWTYEIRSDWDKNVNQICSAPVTIQILILFESKMLTSVQSFIRQQFSQNLFDLSAEELDILVAVTFLPKVCDVNITFINRSLEPFVHIVVYFVNVELGVFQNLLNKVFQISGCHAL